MVVTPRDAEGLIGEAASASEGTVTAKQLENRPLLRPAEILEVVPGLIISQHSGDGKANQYYLRGFNLDHGTDFAASVMGMPVNQPTHGHGQGYLDLQFLIPELVETMHYRKGPYSAEAGDFATAGSASIDYFGTAVDASTPLVRAKGYELGVRSALVPTLQTSLALWRLDLASELVLVGDAGTTEPSFPSRRVAIEWANYRTPTRAITLDADLALSRARFSRIDATVPGSCIPGAIERTLSVGATWDGGGAWSGGTRLRYIGPRALIEDNSVHSKASTIVNMLTAYRLDRKTKLSLDILNVVDSKVGDIDYLYESQLAAEPAPVSDIHTHPAEPRALRLTLRVQF